MLSQFYFIFQIILISRFKSSVYNKWLIFPSILCIWYPQSTQFSLFVNGINAIQKNNGKRESPGIFLFVPEWVATITSFFVFKWSLVFHFSIDNLQNLTVLLLPILLTFLPSYVECCQMLSGNQSRLYLNSCSFSCSPHILLLISLIDPCNLYFRGDILFAVLVVSSALPHVWKFFWLSFLLGLCTWLLCT